MIKEFKAFIERGNVLDLAVGVIVGGAFSNIVTSLVNNVFTPIIGFICGGIDFSGIAIPLNDEEIMVGEFIQSVIDFFITALCVFLIVKFVNKINSDIHKNKQEEKKVEVKKSEDVILLTEIRDLLKEEKRKDR